MCIQTIQQKPDTKFSKTELTQQVLIKTKIL